MDKNIGLYFGSFNPVHIGHFIVANTVLDRMELDEIWFIVSPKSPDKQNIDLLDHRERYNILKEALREDRKMYVSNVEFDMEQPNYTYLTLRKLREKYPTFTFSIIMGSDNANHLEQWVGVQEWKEHHKLYVVERPNHYLEKGILNWYGEDNYVVVEMPDISISSTLIREKVKRGESIKYLVPRESIHRIQVSYKRDET